MYTLAHDKRRKKDAKEPAHSSAAKWFNSKTQHWMQHIAPQLVKACSTKHNKAGGHQWLCKYVLGCKDSYRASRKAVVSMLSSCDPISKPGVYHTHRPGTQRVDRAAVMTCTLLGCPCTGCARCNYARVVCLFPLRTC